MNIRTLTIQIQDFVRKELELQNKRRYKWICMSRWESNAMFVQKEYGAYVDWEERFYNCPFCDEPVYEEDWSDSELDKWLCPICEDAD